MSLEHKKEGREAEVGDLSLGIKTIGEINEAMRMDEVAKEIRGENGRLEGGEQRGRVIDKCSVSIITCF